MRGRDLVDPELAPLVDMFPQLVLSREGLPDIRRQMAASFPTSSPLEGGTEITRQRIRRTSETDCVDLVVFRPAKTSDVLPAFVHFHGGGHVMGAPSMSHIRNCDLVIHGGCVLFSVDYRLAPESPFPSALDDAYTALKWIAANAERLRIDPERIGVIGESAGAGLAASLAQLARDEAEVPLAFQSLIYPMLDDRTGAESLDSGPGVGEFIWTMENNRFAWDALIGSRKSAMPPPRYSVPARMKDLAGLPPTFIAVGALDLFVHENLEYARRLIHAGVSTELHLYPGAIHGFDLVAESALARKFRDDHIAATRRAFGHHEVRGAVVE